MIGLARCVSFVDLSCEEDVVGRCLSDHVFAALFADVCVDPLYQGRGIGTSLVKSLHAYTKSRGLTGFAAFPNSTNWVRRLYRASLLKGVMCRSSCCVADFDGTRDSM